MDQEFKLDNINEIIVLSNKIVENIREFADDVSFERFVDCSADVIEELVDEMIKKIDEYKEEIEECVDNIKLVHQ